MPRPVPWDAAVSGAAMFLLRRLDGGGDSTRRRDVVCFGRREHFCQDHKRFYLSSKKIVLVLRVGKGKGGSESESKTCRVVSLVVLWVPVGVIWATSSLDPARSNKLHIKKTSEKKKKIYIKKVWFSVVF